MQRSTNSDIFITFQQVHILWSIWSKCIFESEIETFDSEKRYAWNKGK